MTKLLAMLCALTCACSLLFESATPLDADASEAAEGLDASLDGPVRRFDADVSVGGMLGPCTIDTGVPSMLRITVEADWMPVQVCGSSQTACADGIDAPCNCMPGAQCNIPFPTGSRVFMEVASCSEWNGPTGRFVGETFDVTITDPGPLIIVKSFAAMMPTAVFRKTMDRARCQIPVFLPAA